MISDLFSSKIWKSKLELDQKDRQDILYQIEKNFKKNKLNSNPEWSCKVHSTIYENNNIDYSKIISYFTKEYETFSRKSNLKIHSYYVSNIWYNYYLNGYNQEIHDHITEDNIYSAVFFLKLDKEHPSIIFHNHTNCHLFYNSRNKIRNVYPINDINHSVVFNSFNLNVEENDFIIFPSYLPHFVPIQKINDPRITISMNFSVDNLDLV
jgi:hypothetical protein